LKKDFERYFEEINIWKCWLNLPPAYVYVCRKKKAFNPKK
jgi:phospholipid N-methyltransferase